VRTEREREGGLLCQLYSLGFLVLYLRVRAESWKKLPFQVLFGGCMCPKASDIVGACKPLQLTSDDSTPSQSADFGLSLCAKPRDMAHRAVSPVPERKAERRNELGSNTALDGIIFSGSGHSRAVSTRILLFSFIL
jgi:hypothetical protein